jgi:hypothetical protein
MADLKDLASRYGVLKDKLNAQDFGPNDSIIASSLMHPQEAARRAKDVFMRSIDAAGGVPREILDESSVFPFGIAPSIDEQAQAGLDLAGLMQTGAMPFAPASAGGTLGMAIKAYHGTPHLFDSFDISKIGTGEGAQAYGHGLYFAQEPSIAESYRKNLSAKDIAINDKKSDLITDMLDKSVLDYITTYGNKNAALDALNEKINYGSKFDDIDWLKNVKNKLELSKIEQPSGNLYETSIRWPNAEREAMDPLGEHHLLDWDQPLSEQSDYVRNILQSHDPDLYHPEGLDYDPVEKGSSILQRLGSGKEGAQKLYELGIPGTTYMGEKAKVADPEGVRNFVTYSDEVPRVVTRNMNKVKPLTNEDRLNDLEKQMSAYMKTKRMPKGVDFKTGSDWYDWAYDKRDALRQKLSNDDQGYAEGGEVDLSDNQQMKAIPQQPNLAKLAELLQTAKSSGNQYSVPDWVPLLGGSGAGDMLLGNAPEEIENWSYGDMPMRVPEMSNVPQFKKGRAQSLADTAMLLAGPAESTARNAMAGNVGMIIKPKGGNFVKGASYYITPEDAAMRYAQPTDPRFPHFETVNDWLQQKLAKYIKNEMGTPEDPIRRIAEEWPAKRDVLISQQQSKIPNLKEIAAKYEDMGLPPEVIASRMANAQREAGTIQNKIAEIESYNPLHYKPDKEISPYNDVEELRKKAGYPAEGIAKSDLGKLWEHYTDNAFTIDKAKELLDTSPRYLQANPWLESVPENQNVYAIKNTDTNDTGFYDLATKLRNAINPESDLPDFLRIDPAKLSRVSVPQAVEHAAKINAWRDAERLKEGRNAATVMHKEYPDQGLSWMQMKMPESTLQEGHYLGEDSRGNPAVLDASGSVWSSESTPEEALAKYRNAERRDALQAALKFEGDTMGHCVGQYCDEVGRGDTNIYSLRDRRGEPHVTIETKGDSFDPDEFLSLNKDLLADPRWSNRLKQIHSDEHISPQGKIQKLMNEMSYAGETFIQPKPMEKIVQIKGKQNAAPNEKYLPAIQDFVRSQDWSMVHDLPNSGLLRLQKYKSDLNDDLYNQALEKHGSYVTQEELNALQNEFYERNKDIPLKGFAKGGEVSMDDLHFNDEDALRMYHQEMDRMGNKISNTGASKKTGKGTARVNYSTLTKGDIGKEIALHTLMANYGVDVGDLNLDAGLIKPMEADGLYIGDLTGSLPLGEGRASLGVQGIHSKYDDGLSGYTAGYNGKVGDGNLSARYFEPADHNSAGRQVQLEYDMPFAKGGSVQALHDKYEESDYGYGNRPDKTKKGLGYFGELERPDGTGVMTEYSIGVPINGEEMDVPTLIPTLTPDEIRLILHMQDGEDMPRSIVHKAIDHAHQRLSEGKPIFATEEDLYAHGGIVDVLHNDAIEQIMKAFMDSMEDEQEEEEPAAVSIQITTHSQPLKSGKIPTSIREAKHG